MSRHAIQFFSIFVSGSTIDTPFPFPIKSEAPQTDRLIGGCYFFLDLSICGISPASHKKIHVKICLLSNLENFDFFDLKMIRTCQKSHPVESAVIDLRMARAIEISQTFGVCVAIIFNINVMKV
jgi:hypothetical protein